MSSEVKGPGWARTPQSAKPQFFRWHLPRGGRNPAHSDRALSVRILVASVKGTQDFSKCTYPSDVRRVRNS